MEAVKVNDPGLTHSSGFQVEEKGGGRGRKRKKLMRVNRHMMDR